MGGADEVWGRIIELVIVALLVIVILLLVFPET